MPVTKLTPGTPGNGSRLGIANSISSRPKPRSPSASSIWPNDTLSSGGPMVSRCKTCEAVSRGVCSDGV